MELQLIRIGPDEVEALWRMQVKSFSALYETYQDAETSPATETVDRIRQRLMQPFTRYYWIVAEAEKVGAIRVVDHGTPERAKRISPIFILPAFRNRGYAQEAIRLVEAIHGSTGWELDTILEEPGNCYLYEKLGYKRTGKLQPVNERMTLVFYRKE